MAPKTKPKKIDVKDVEIQDAVPADIHRDTQMFVEHCRGLTQAEIAVKFGVSEGNVNRIASKWKWKKKRQELADRAMKRTQGEIESTFIDVVSILGDDMKRLKRRLDKSDTEATKDERTYVMAAFDRIGKEVRLEAGKPTDNTGTLSVELVLPPGVTRFGPFGPSSKVKMIEHEEEAAKEEIDLDSIEDDINDSKE